MDVAVGLLKLHAQMNTARQMILRESDHLPALPFQGSPTWSATRSNETSRLLVILTPGAFEKCIRTIRDNPPDKILEIAGHYGCFIVRPPIGV